MKPMQSLTRQIGALLIAIGLCGAPAAAQDYPARAITFVVPFAPGGTTDIAARLVGHALEERLGQPVVIENRPGAGSLTAAATVARASPDGYTIMMAASPAIAINPALYKQLPYDPVADFVPIALLVDTPFVLAVNPSLPVATVADLVKLAHEKPGGLAFSSPGVGTPHHLFAELMQSMTGIRMTHVPYRGSVQALNDLVAGHVQVMFSDIAPAQGLIGDGKIRALGVSSKRRVPAMADLAPIAELGLPDFDAASWMMVVAPSRTPPQVVDKLHVEIKRIAETPDFRGQTARMGMIPVDTPDVPGLQDYVKAEIAKWSEVVQRAGIAGSQ